MSAENPQPDPSSKTGAVKVADWNACLNPNDNSIVLSCTVTTVDSGAGITGVGLILNTPEGVTLSSLYVGLSGGLQSVSPALNVASGELAEGDNVLAVAQGACDGRHFFFEQELTIGSC